MSWQEILFSVIIILSAPVWIMLLVIAVLAMWIELVLEKIIYKVSHPTE